MSDCCSKQCDYLFCEYKKRIVDGTTEYYTRKKMPSGMTAEFFFEVYALGSKKSQERLIVEPSFIVYKKRKDAWKIPQEVTGKDRLEPLIFAKEKILQLERIVCKSFASKSCGSIYIEVGWSNKRRGDLYKKILMREGYELAYEDKTYYLRKKVYQREEEINLY